MKSYHPYNAFIPENATKLIIGTIPPPRFCRDLGQLSSSDVRFYYGSKDNGFWPLIEEVFDIKLEYCNNDMSILQRKKLLQRLNIGITDVIESCIHCNNSAKDDDLIEITYRDLKPILQHQTSIDTLIYTSEFVKKIVNKNYKTRHRIDKVNKKNQTVKIYNKVYKVIILYSPSPLALINMGINGDLKRKEQYRTVFSKF